MDTEQLRAILDSHRSWLAGEPSGRRANLTNADLVAADLAGADLTGGNLAGANLAGANLTRADLTDADLVAADLAGADLTGGNLTYANLAGADLAGADLTHADLTHAYLAGAHLSHNAGTLCQAAERTRDWLHAHKWIQRMWFSGIWDAADCGACLHGAALIAGGPAFSHALIEHGYTIDWNDSDGRTIADVDAALDAFCSPLGEAGQP